MAGPVDELVSLAALVVIAAAALATVLIGTYLFSRLRPLDDDDGALGGALLVGTLARVSLAIPARGVGVVVCLASQAGIRLPARSDDALPVPAGEQVVIVELAGGTAVVLPLPH